MTVFCVRTNGFKKGREFSDKGEFDRFVDLLGDRLERLWVEVREVGKK
jgi:cell division septum initiation protein DivIVA